MSVREEDRQKTGCPSRGLGIAAAAIGVGVGAALYYFFSQRPENPDSEGSTSSEWTCERPQVFQFMDQSEESDLYTTISEHSTSDTSIHDDSLQLQRIWSIDTNNTSMSENDSIVSLSDSTISEQDSTVSDMHSTLSETNSSSSENNSSISEYDLTVSENSDSSNNESSMSELSVDSENDSSTSEEGYTASEDSLTPEGTRVADNYNELMNSLFDTIETTVQNLENNETGYLSSIVDTIASDSETAMEWDITNSSLDIPRDNRRSPLINLIGGLRSMISPRKKTEEDQLSMLRDQAFRERSWSLEECSICFDVMLKDHELMTLPCTHNFHAACIMPWLQEKQTCPNCRKVAE